MDDYRILTDAAKKAMTGAYAPYSRCFVGAALLACGGKIYTGCNIENSAHTPTCCAERTAFFKAVSEGEREFDAIAVAGGFEGKITGLFPPCGVCRQVMAEFCDRETFKVIMVGKDGNVILTLAELLPFGFDKDYIKNE